MKNERGFTSKHKQNDHRKESKRTTIPKSPILLTKIRACFKDNIHYNNII
jgi:hypothetical protein